MRITVKLSGPLRKYLGGAEPLNLQPGSVLRDLLSVLGLPDGSVSLLVVNGEKASPGRELKDGDQVNIYPPICGG